MGDGFYRSKAPTNSIKVLEEMLQDKEKKRKQLNTHIHRVSKTSKIIFVITTSNFHQIWQFLAQRWQIVKNYMRCTHFPSWHLPPRQKWRMKVLWNAVRDSVSYRKNILRH